ncbi:hypothetical protein ACF3NX_14310 (plasmid) [Acetobacter orientalis]|uniref:hypothetical protein n=1 Tax=Acetobacter orientalis TaxID=146474 RepID=UPI0038707EF7
MTSTKTKRHVRALMSFAICGSLCGERAFAEPGFFQHLGETLASVAPDHYSPTIVLSPGAVLTFGDKKYAIFGTDGGVEEPLIDVLGP